MDQTFSDFNDKTNLNSKAKLDIFNSLNRQLIKTNITTSIDNIMKYDD
jgi:hypothetical protein